MKGSILRVALLVLLTAILSFGQSSVRVNVGGPLFVDHSGNTWLADTGCSSTTTFDRGSGIPVGGTLDPTLYQTGRADPSAVGCTYTVTNFAFYIVTLKFAVTDPAITTTNSQVLNIFINNFRYADRVDMVQRCGQNTINVACDLGFGPIPVSNGQVNIVVAQVGTTPPADYAFLNAIDIEFTGTIGPIGPTGPPGPQGPGGATCIIDNDTQSNSPLATAQFSGGCEIKQASTITEVDVWGGTGVLGGSFTTTGTGSINLQKFTPNGGATTTLLSGALATASGYACAKTTTSSTCINGLTSSNSITISTTALAAGDWVRVSSSSPDSTQTWYRIAVAYSIP